MGAHWKYKVTCACLIKKLWILNEVVMMAKTGRVASNGFIYRGGGGKPVSLGRLTTGIGIAPMLLVK